MDKGSALGVFLAIVGIVGGLTIDGGNVGQVLQPSAFLIVAGGTLGAILLQFPFELVLRSVTELKTVFLHKAASGRAVMDQIVGLANKARKQGVVSLDKDLDSIAEPFLRKAVMLAVDGVQPAEVRNTMEFELAVQTEQSERMAQIFEAAGGYSPTIGIIGAILGLIQVMQHLDNIGEVGKGIAVAFVATIYGVAFANIFFLPVAGKLRVRRRQSDLHREMMLEGVIAILEGINPRMLQTKLASFLDEADMAASADKAGAAKAPRPEPAES